MTRTILHTIGLLGLTLALAQPASAEDITYIGIWDDTALSGNPVGVGGPGLSNGQRYVLVISYDNLSATTDGVDVLTTSFGVSGNLMQTINMQAPGNSLDIFVPLEGLDSGGPFIYQQDQTDFV